MRRFVKSLVAVLAVVNLALAVGVHEAQATSAVAMRTCSVETATGGCRCHHTIVQECDTNGSVSAQCQTQCALAVD